MALRRVLIEWMLLVGFITLLALAPFASADEPNSAHTGAVKAAPRVTKVSLKATKAKFSVVCPRNLEFRGSIATSAATKVKYTWVSSDHHSWPELELTAKGAGSHPVSGSWTVGQGDYGRAVKGWIQLKALAPDVMESARVDVAIVCGNEPPADHQPPPPGT